MREKTEQEEAGWSSLDSSYVWHPYSAMQSGLLVYPVESASGVRIKLADGRELIDGMASWWCAIHGYNHPVLNQAIEAQLRNMSHVMFGGLTHQPACELAELLISISPKGLQSVFFTDSGSVSVEVAMKMAIQYWAAKGQTSRQRFITLEHGYHGDTLGAMSVCDPVNGMHSLFAEILPRQIFVSSPGCRFGETCTEADIAPMHKALAEHSKETAAVILEPIVQGAGGMRFYSADYLAQVRLLCDQYDVLLITDEIATGFGRSGKLFACEHAGISPDILCLGKALTGGYMTLAATLTTEKISSTISHGEPGVFMHGPTFMANPLACSVALASTRLLLESSWQQRVTNIERILRDVLNSCAGLDYVNDVRVQGAIGVIELESPVDMKTVQAEFVEQRVWVRPFGRLVYLMPPYVISEDDLRTLAESVVTVVKNLEEVNGVMQPVS